MLTVPETYNLKTYEFLEVDDGRNMSDIIDDAASLGQLKVFGVGLSNELQPLMRPNRDTNVPGLKLPVARIRRLDAENPLSVYEQIILALKVQTGHPVLDASVLPYTRHDVSGGLATIVAFATNDTTTNPDSPYKLRRPEKINGLKNGVHREALLIGLSTVMTRAALSHAA